VKLLVKSSYQKLCC